MTTIDYSSNDIYVAGDMDLSVKRTRSLNADTELEIFSGEKLILKTHFNTLLPYSKVRIIHQNMENTVSFTYNDNVLEWGANWLKISHNRFNLFTKRLCTVYFNDEKLLDVTRKKLILSLDTGNIDGKLALYTVLFLIVHYSDIDGGE